MKIDRHNYEECFILYWDDELTLSQKQAVENFVKENSDLQEEFNILGETRFTPDNKIQFEEKNFLLNTSAINITNYEEQLLNYIDDELSSAERKEIERTAEKFPLVQQELLLLQKTKLQPEKIAFPDKSSLYRRERVRIISMTWFRVAVAAAIILIAGFTVLQLVNTNTNSNTGPVVEAGEIKTQPVDKPEQPALTTADPKIPGKDLPKELAIKADPPGNKKKTPLAKKEDLESANEIIDQKSIALNQPENINNLPKEGPRTTAALTDGITPDVKVLEEKDATGVSTNGNDVIPVDLANSAVTLKDNPSLYIPGPEKGRGGGLKELLRKTTRVFERRTKIQTTTEDNKLLVGVFAVSLK